MNTPENNPAEITLPISMLKPIGLIGLAKIYGVHYRTLRKWLAPFHEKIGPRIGRYFTINQVRTIAQNIGLPASEA